MHKFTSRDLTYMHAHISINIITADSHSPLHKDYTQFRVVLPLYLLEIHGTLKLESFHFVPDIVSHVFYTMTMRANQEMHSRQAHTC